MAAGHKGVKLARFDLLPWDALWQVALVFGKGAEKYAERNWERGLDYNAIAGAIGRHAGLWIAGQRRDEESGLSHMAHLATLALFALAHELRGVGNDNLPPQAHETMVAEVTNPEDLAAAKQEVDLVGGQTLPPVSLCDNRYSHGSHTWSEAGRLVYCPGKSTDRT